MAVLSRVMAQSPSTQARLLSRLPPYTYELLLHTRSKLTPESRLQPACERIIHTLRASS